MSLEPKVVDPRNWASFAETTFKRHSPLYWHLFQGMKQDAEIFSLLALVDQNQPVPVLFLCAVQYLLRGEPEHPLAQFFPQLATGTVRPPAEAYPYFRDFCLTHLSHFQHLLPPLRLQTNEVSRCSHLLPAFERVSCHGGHKPLALIEVGSSAGLNLFWDRFGYTYHAGEETFQVGQQGATVQLQCAFKGSLRPSLPAVLPSVSWRQGIDLSPLDITREADRRWLASCIWPEEALRYNLLEAAIAEALADPPHLLAGDACSLLPSLLAEVPAETTLCVYHSYALTQGPAQARACILNQLATHSRQRPIYRVALEIDPDQGWREPHLELFIYHQGEVISQEWLASCDIHGTEMRWLVP
ncbi:DUF2332 domain-containing protein [Ktedonosporobacter rubrisoli]|uniref:DUF2332 domain-containing protein n=1 Tax=Ktedonosporobacter rubrisoli TaxID=2509675 RepID=A0A4P6JXX5_KTERU|nr:DUF2332 domain-containing protein [Ktedonosporobacter rubrisoli]QBD80629.1 DUF2332 domain-containing protein [Ktedonosporobacter rubrisoli]